MVYEMNHIGTADTKSSEAKNSCNLNKVQVQVYDLSKKPFVSNIGARG